MDVFFVTPDSNPLFAWELWLQVLTELIAIFIIEIESNTDLLSTLIFFLLGAASSWASAS